MSEFEKAMVVSKLKGARGSASGRTGVKVEGRKNYAEIKPEMVALAKKLRRHKVQGRTWRRIIARSQEEAEAKMAALVASGEVSEDDNFIYRIITGVPRSPHGVAQ